MIFSGSGRSLTRLCKSAKSLKGAWSRASRISRRCFLPMPGKSSSWCLLVVMGPALLIKLMNLAWLLRTRSLMTKPSSARAVSVSFEGLILPRM